MILVSLILFILALELWLVLWKLNCISEDLGHYWIGFVKRYENLLERFSEIELNILTIRGRLGKMEQALESIKVRQFKKETNTITYTWKPKLLKSKDINIKDRGQRLAYKQGWNECRSKITSSQPDKFEYKTSSRPIKADTLYIRKDGSVTSTFPKEWTVRPIKKK